MTFTCRVFGSASLEWRSPLITLPTSYRAGDVPPGILNQGPFTISLINVSGTTWNANFTSTLQVTASRMIARTDTTVTCLSGTLESETDFTVGSFHIKSTQKNPYPHQFEQKLVLTQCQLRH